MTSNILRHNLNIMLSNVKIIKI